MRTTITHIPKDNSSTRQRSDFFMAGVGAQPVLIASGTRRAQE
jgi:hypothetical protein